MSEPILYHDWSAIQTTDLAALRSALDGLTRFVREREPRLLYYGFVIDEPAATMHVLAVHPDSASLELHLGIGGPEFAKVGVFIELKEIELFGTPSPAAVEQLRQKAAMLGKNAGVSIHELAAGFERISALGR